VTRPVLAATAVLAFGALAGCGSDTDGVGSAYCSDLETTRVNLATINGGDLSELVATTDQLHAVAAEAPQEVAEEWETFVGGFDAILAAFREAGFDSADDMAGLKDGAWPSDVDVVALQDAMDEIQELGDDEFKKAGDAISDHADRACGVDLTA
jgi:hypothetical protein